MRVCACITAAIAIFIAASLPADAAQFYTVAPHDTLYSIARRFGVPLSLLVTVNGIHDPSKIQVGTVLRIPDAPAPRRNAPQSSAAPHPAAAAGSAPSGSQRTATANAASVGRTPDASARASGEPGSPARVPVPRTITYVVRSGDTLYHIAQAYGVTVTQLQEANHLASPDVLSAGQVLRIPRPAAAPTVVGAAPAVLSAAPAMRTAAPAIQGTAPVRSTVPDRASVSTPPPVLSSTERTGLLARRVTSEALGYLGTPYVWGGVSPSGVDCSGLVYLVYEPYVPDIPRRSYDQWNAGVPVGRSDLAPGDLVFFNTDGSGASHVGIYIGDGRFVHPSATPRRVVIDDLDAPYYAGHYMGARRVL